jgi:hypothetical protein
MPIIKKPFVCYDIANKVKGPLPVKLNEDDELMLSIAMYMFNLDSKGGALKKLAHCGLKVLLGQFSMDQWHYLTLGKRTRYLQEKPNVSKYLSKGIMETEE